MQDSWLAKLYFLFSTRIGRLYVYRPLETYPACLVHQQIKLYADSYVLISGFHTTANYRIHIMLRTVSRLNVVAKWHWSKQRNSNPHTQLGRMVCYHYIMPAYNMWITQKTFTAPSALNGYSPGGFSPLYFVKSTNGDTAQI